MGRHRKYAPRVTYEPYVLLLDGYPSLPWMWLAEDAYCNKRFYVFVPLIGTFGLAYTGGRVRTQPCPDCERLTKWVSDEESKKEQA